MAPRNDHFESSWREFRNSEEYTISSDFLAIFAKTRAPIAKITERKCFQPVQSITAATRWSLLSLTINTLDAYGSPCTNTLGGSFSANSVQVTCRYSGEKYLAVSWKLDSCKKYTKQLCLNDFPQESVIIAHIGCKYSWTNTWIENMDKVEKRPTHTNAHDKAYSHIPELCDVRYPITTLLLTHVSLTWRINGLYERAESVRASRV